MFGCKVQQQVTIILPPLQKYQLVAARLQLRIQGTSHVTAMTTTCQLSNSRGVHGLDFGFF